MARFLEAKNPRQVFVNQKRGQIGYRMRAYWGSLNADPIGTANDLYILEDDSYTLIGKYASIDKNGQFYHNDLPVDIYLNKSGLESTCFAVYYEYNGSLIQLDYMALTQEDKDNAIDSSNYMRSFKSIESAVSYTGYQAGDVVEIVNGRFKVVSNASAVCDNSYAIFISESIQLQMISGSLSKGVEFKVGASGFFDTIEEAVNSLLKVNGSISLKLESGYAGEELEITGYDLSRFKLSGSDVKNNGQLKLNSSKSPFMDLGVGLKSNSSYVAGGSDFGDNYKESTNPTQDAIGKHEYTSSVIAQSNATNSRRSAFSGGYNIESRNSLISNEYVIYDNVGLNLYNSKLTYKESRLSRNMDLPRQQWAFDGTYNDVDAVFMLDSSTVNATVTSNRVGISSVKPFTYKGGCSFNAICDTLNPTYIKFTFDYKALTTSDKLTTFLCSVPPVLTDNTQETGSMRFFGNANVTTHPENGESYNDFELLEGIVVDGAVASPFQSVATENVNYWATGSFPALLGGSCSVELLSE